MCKMYTYLFINIILKMKDSPGACTDDSITLNARRAAISFCWTPSLLINGDGFVVCTSIVKTFIKKPKKMSSQQVFKIILCPHHILYLFNMLVLYYCPANFGGILYSSCSSNIFQLDTSATRIWMKAMGSNPLPSFACVIGP